MDFAKKNKLFSIIVSFRSQIILTKSLWHKRDLKKKANHRAQKNIFCSFRGFVSSICYTEVRVENTLNCFKRQSDMVKNFVYCINCLHFLLARHMTFNSLSA